VKPKRRVPKLPMLEVVWEDSLLLTGGWEAHREAMKERKRIRQRSMGYVLADDKRGVMLTGSLSQGGNVFGTLVIPASQIISRRRIK